MNLILAFWHFSFCKKTASLLRSVLPIWKLLRLPSIHARFALRGLSCFGLVAWVTVLLVSIFLFSWTVIWFCFVLFSFLIWSLGLPAFCCFIAGIFVSPMCFFAYVFLISGLVVNLEPNSGTSLFANRFCCNLLMVTERIMLLVVLSEFFYENALRVPRR